MKDGFVYIVTHDSAKWRASHPVVKIGKAVNVEKRIRELNTASPVNLILVASIESNNCLALEHYLHKTFSEHRLNGEWFELTPGIITMLRNCHLAADRFDELFEFGTNAPDAKDLEIRALRNEIERLNAKLGKRDAEIHQLKGIISARNRDKSAGPLQVHNGYTKHFVRKISR